MARLNLLMQPPHLSCILAWVLLVPGFFHAFAAGDTPAASQRETKPIPFSEIGAKATADYKGDAIGSSTRDTVLGHHPSDATAQINVCLRTHI